MPVTITRTARGYFAVAAALALALTACSPSGGSNESPSTSSVASPSSDASDGSTQAASPTSQSASPTPIAASSEGPAKNWPVPKMPALAKKKSPEGAAAFAKHYFELIEYTSTTTETSPIKKVSLPSCKACQEDVISTSDYNKENHAWNAGGAYHPTITAAQKSEAGYTVVAFKYNQDKRIVYDSKGKINAVYDPTQKPIYGTFRLVWNNGWKMQTIDIVQQ